MSTYTRLNYHIVFSTKNRVPSIENAWMKDLHAYLGGIVKNENGVPLEVGGVQDHVHMLVRLKPTQCVSDLVREVKRGSSIWVHNKLSRATFEWQEGYAAFSVGIERIGPLRQYISTQPEHHNHVSSKEELRQSSRKRWSSTTRSISHKASAG